MEKVTKLSKLAWNITSAKIHKHPHFYRHAGKLTYNTVKELGPTYIKIGQFISTRSDIFGEDFTNELRQLQDNVNPMTREDLDFLKAPIQANFKSIDDTPIAAASIGQVHLAHLRDDTQVALKFRRRNISKTIHEDFTLLLAFIRVIKLFTNHRQIQELEISLTEYYNLLQEEIDFQKEVSNMETFSHQFRHEKYLKVPKPIKELCTPDIIVMEYVPAYKINQLPDNYDAAKVSQKLLECFFNQVVQHGFVHIDPHPGNVGMSPSGQLVFYDYGMFVELEPDMKNYIKSLFLALYDRDVDQFTNILLQLKIVIVEPSKVPHFKKFIASFMVYIDNLDIESFKLSYLDKIDQSEMQFLISSKFILLLRGMTILEGVCKQLDPNFNYRAILDQYITDFVVDIHYLENKGSRDIARFTSTPNLITQSQITINLLEHDLELVKTNYQKLKNRLIYLSIFAVLFSHHPPEHQAIAFAVLYFMVM